MNSKQKIQLAVWTVLSICVSAFFSFIGLAFIMIRTLDLHKNSSAPGDFKVTTASVILNDILVNCGLVFVFLSVIAWGGYEWTKTLSRDFSTPPNTPLNREPVSRWLYGLFIFNVLLLCAGTLFGGISYWQQRAPFFPK